MQFASRRLLEAATSRIQGAILILRLDLACGTEDAPIPSISLRTQDQDMVGMKNFQIWRPAVQRINRFYLRQPSPVNFIAGCRVAKQKNTNISIVSP